MTDLQLADVQSPTRFEFLNRYFADPRYAQIVPVQRPQEALTAHAVEATLRTLNAVTGPVTGLAPQLAVTTGDAIDNAQWNEMEIFLALFDGGLVRPDSGGPGYEGVQSPDWPDDIFWKPRRRPAGANRTGGYDIFRREFGFPHHPGLLERALQQFSATGLRVPWLSCFGNHEALNQGVGVVTAGIEEALVGGSKPLRLPPGFDHDRALELFTAQPEAFMAGPVMAVTADPGRRPITRQDFVDAHFRPGSRPFGHGFSEQNRLDGTAYYVHDQPAARLIALDTNCLAGAPPDASTGIRRGGWRHGSPRCTRPTGARTDSGCGPVTMTAWSSCSPITGSTRSPIPGMLRGRTAAPCSARTTCSPSCTASPMSSCG